MLSDDDARKLWTWDLHDDAAGAPPQTDPAYKVLNRAERGVAALLSQMDILIGQLAAAPGGLGEDRIRAIVREELDATRLAGGP